jgi:hypothetical protein
MESAGQIPLGHEAESRRETFPEVDRFKRSHLKHWPGTAYLQKLFGPAWTDEFLHQFLYR